VYGSSKRKIHVRIISMVRDKVAEEEWKYLFVNKYWQQIKNIMIVRAQDIFGMSKGPCRHKKTW